MGDFAFRSDEQKVINEQIINTLRVHLIISELMSSETEASILSIFTVTDHWILLPITEVRSGLKLLRSNFAFQLVRVNYVRLLNRNQPKPV